MLENSWLDFAEKVCFLEVPIMFMFIPNLSHVHQVVCEYFYVQQVLANLKEPQKYF